MKIWQYITSFFKRWTLLLNFSHFISTSFRKSLAIFSNSSTLLKIVWSDFKADSLLLWSLLVALEAFLCARLTTLTFFEVLSFVMVSCFFVSFVWNSVIYCYDFMCYIVNVIIMNLDLINVWCLTYLEWYNLNVYDRNKQWKMFLKL